MDVDDNFLCYSLWGGDCSEKLSKKFRYRCSDTTHTFGELGELIRDGLSGGVSPEDLAALNQNPKTTIFSPAVVSHAVQYKYGRAILAQCPSVSGEILTRIVRTRELHATYSVAANIAAPEQLLRELATSTDVVIRSKIAANPATPSELLEELARDRDANVRAGAASNPTLPEFLWRELADDSVNMVRLAVGRNESTPKETISILSRSASSDDRSIAASHRNLDKNDAIYLAQDHDWRVRGALASTWPETALLDAMARDTNTGVRSNVASNSAISAELIELLSRDHDYSVRYKLALNPSISVDVYARLALDPHRGVRKNLTLNPSSPLRLRKQPFVDLVSSRPNAAWLLIFAQFEIDDDLANLVQYSCRSVSLPIDDFSDIGAAQLELLASWMMAGDIALCEESTLALLQLIMKKLSDCSWTRLFSEYVLNQTNPKLVYQAKEILRSHRRVPVSSGRTVPR